LLDGGRRFRNGRFLGDYLVGTGVSECAGGEPSRTSEVGKNIRAKIGTRALQRFHSLLAATEIEIGEPATVEEEEQWAQYTAGKTAMCWRLPLKQK
jgi:hypothetical protein